MSPYFSTSQKVCCSRATIPALRAETAFHQPSSASRLQGSFTLMPSANLIQSAKRWLGTAITTGISALSARSTRYESPLPSRSWRPKRLTIRQIGSLIDRAGDPLAGTEQLADVEPAAGRAAAEVLEQGQLFTGMHQHGGQFGVDAMMAKLHQPDRAIAAAVQVGGKFAQDFIRVLMLVVDQSCKVA